MSGKRYLTILELMIPMLLVLCLSAPAQDFGQLLNAVDKLETSLKEMVSNEQGQREEAISQLQAEMNDLRAQIKKLNNQPTGSGQTASSGNIEKNINSLVSNNLRFRAQLNEHTLLIEELRQNQVGTKTSFSSNNYDAQLANLSSQINSLKNELNRVRGQHSTDIATPGPVNINIPHKPNLPVEFSGFVDASNYSDFNSQESGFGLDQVEIDIIRDFEGTALLRADLEYVSDGAGGFGFDLEQGFLSYNFGGSPWALTFGKFNAPIGFELLDAPDMYQYSHSLVFDNGLPTNLTGIQVSAGYEKVDWCFYVVNGWDVNSDNNNDKTIGTRVGFTPINDFNFGFSAISGPEQDDNNSSRRTVLDYDMTLTMVPNLTFGAEFNYGIETKIINGDENGNWNGFLVMANWAISDRVGLTGRFDMFNDNDGLRTGTEQKLTSFTVSPSLSIIDGLGGLFELRYDKSDVDSFSDKDGVAKDNQVTAALEFTYGF